MGGRVALNVVDVNRKMKGLEVIVRQRLKLENTEIAELKRFELSHSFLKTRPIDWSVTFHVAVLYRERGQVNGTYAKSFGFET